MTQKRPNNAYYAGVGLGAIAVKSCRTRCSIAACDGNAFSYGGFGRIDLNQGLEDGSPH